MKLSFESFCPAKGTRRLFEISEAQRKAEGLRYLAAYVVDFFNGGERVTVKSHGVYHTIGYSAGTQTFSIKSKCKGGSLSQSGLAPMDALDFMCDTFEPTVLLRVAKLLEKNRRDRNSLTSADAPKNVIVVSFRPHTL